MTIRRIVLLTLAAACAVLGVLPAIGSAGGELDVRAQEEGLRHAEPVDGR